MEGKRILVADDHPLSREGLSMALRHVLPGANVVCAGTIKDAEILAAQRSGFRMALLEMMLPDTKGFSGLLRLQFCLPGVPVAIITARKEPGLAAIARDLGAVAFLSKSMPLEQLSNGLREIDAGRSVFPPSVGPKHAMPIRDRIASLSQAQRRVLFALADGRANKQIAHDLSITEATVKAHLTAIFRKLAVTNRMQAMIALQPLLGEAA
jgi:DNA-binding NarL/FixJ family response regulator